MTGVDQRVRVQTFLRRHGLLAAGDPVDMTPLTGGVSSDLWKVDLPTRTICVKGALAQLKVAGDWLAPVSRNDVEYDWLTFAAQIRPGQIPQVIAHDRELGLFAMEFLPPSEYPVWKALLLAGQVDLGAARQVGALVGALHSASAADPAAATRFATDANFDALRINPFLRVTAQAHPDLADRFAELAVATSGTHLVVVHGDVSPKNILLGSRGPVLLDAECAWFGDPAFDIAFVLNHLLLKSVKRPDRAAELLAAAGELAAEYTRYIDWEPPGRLERRVAALLPALVLARLDGTSPVEYLAQDQRQVVGTIGRALLRRPAETVDELVERWSRRLVHDRLDRSSELNRQAVR
jgi:tRNA A-37 threonylcarbamoyl transferase component Bud32